MLARRRAVALVGLYGCVVLGVCVCVAAWPGALTGGDTCPSSEWNAMCRPCCEYQLIRCRCPSKGSRVGYTVPCCRNALDQCDPCIVHPGCSLFENCKTCHNGTWKANDDFFVNGKYCTECRSGWSGGDCKACGGVVQRPQGHVALEGYPTNARCEWTVRAERGHTIELRFTLLSLESDPSCRYDYVEVRDGDDLSSPVIGRFCGDQLPPRMNSSGSHLHILFISDGYNNFDGFVFTFQQTSASYTGEGCEAVSDTDSSPSLASICPAPGAQRVHLHSSQSMGTCCPHTARRRSWSPSPMAAIRRSRCLAPSRTCLNGTWSGTEPACVQGQPSRVQCPPLKLLNGYQRPAVDAAGGAEAVEFVCKKPYVLDGQHQSTCLSDGSWSSRPPKCVRASLWMKLDGWREDAAVFSFLPLPGSHSLRLYVFRFTTQDLLSAGFLPLTLARKSDVERGEAAAEKLPRGFHRVYTSIEYRCASPLFRHTGSPRRTCLRTGRWSGRHVSCSPVCGKFNTFSARGLSDAPWPWHAAVYVRSAGTQRPRGAAVSHQQGPSEESARWRLACSGALLSQRSVLVTAECVADKVEQRPLHPAHVKVVIGPQHQTPKDALKGLRQLRVSDILVHPRFYSAPASSVAVLKLQDKAKISQRVLPVCLHTMGEVTTQRAYVSRWILTNNHGHLSRFAPSSHTELVQLSDVAQCERESARGGANSTVTGDNSLCVVSRPSRPRSSCPGVIPGLTVAPATSSPAADALWGHTETQEASESSWQLLGLETFSYEETNCHKQTHTLQTRVAHFQAWIEKSMK